MKLSRKIQAWHSNVVIEWVQNTVSESPTVREGGLVNLALPDGRASDTWAIPIVQNEYPSRQADVAHLTAQESPSFS